ncbi:prolipoprotein diacylglyceryl transferase [Candidatus Woesearchaeota archaeon]|jgi:phosphatidylglycerol---prolipoprotein diacylglyceryl transferase|nr:prolipoprotein diacylglyceryl transferase [Candidatus Woesearchaeota archaeon]MBT6520145.1 prolipoprotein diacylglyceryl transferase [Candidatus Woesearchaeota archaeon]MBT7366750.1 prolipoprotein diacylglyceryl transferase [Candidatus Woesearchaeota archaeon]
MWYINFDPAVFRIGAFELRWYSLIYILGFVIAYLWLRYIGNKKWIKEFDHKTAEDFLLYLMIGVIVGSRLFEFIFYMPSVLLSDPLEIFRIWHGGMSFHGGLIGTFIAVGIFCWKHKIKFWKILDAISIVAIGSLMLGRLGNLVNGELIGTKFNGAWCAVYVGYDSVCRHPYAVYAFISHLILVVWLGVLIYLNRDRLKTFFGSKWLSINFLIGYGVLRIIVDFFKLDNMLWGIRTGQWLSIFMIIAGIALIISHIFLKKAKKDRKT